MSNWIVNTNKRFLYKIYSDNESITSNGSIVISDPTLENVNINSFPNVKLNNADIHNISSNIEYIELSLPEKYISLLIDNSGSESWNDKDNKRFLLAQDLINRISSTYPGIVKYNIFSCKGKPISVSSMAIALGSNPFDKFFEKPPAYIAVDPFTQVDNNFAGVRVVKKIGSYPLNPLDGSIVFEGIANAALDTGLVNGQHYYYSLFGYNEGYTFSPVASRIDFSYVDPPQPPLAIKNVSGEVLSGSGTIVDSNTIAAWHMNSIRTDRIYDFAGNLDLNFSDINGIRWFTDLIPSGNAALRFSNTFFCSNQDPKNVLKSNNTFTIMGWVYLFDSSQNNNVLSRSNSDGSNTDYNLAITSFTRKLSLTYRNSTLTSSVGSIPLNTWTFISVTISNNTVKYYINGVLDSTLIFSLPSYILDIYSVNMGSLNGSTNNFNGLLTEVSLSKSTRSQSYISQAALGSTTTIRDNGDRLCLIKYSINSDSPLIGGNLSLVVNNFNSPSWNGDGNSIYSSTISSGNFYKTYVNNLVLNRTYYFKLFSQNSLGVYSLFEDCVPVNLTIPDIDTEDLNLISSVSLPTPSILNYIKGDRKNYISWDTSFLNSNVGSILIVYSNSSYPIFNNTLRTFTGTLVINSDPSIGNYLHQGLNNDLDYYYSVVYTDRYGRYSSVINIFISSESLMQEINIPVQQPNNLSYDMMDSGQAKISWNNYFTETFFDGFMTDDVLFFSKITDEYNTLDNDLSTLTITPIINFTFGRDSDAVPDIFQGETTVTDYSPNSLYSFVFNVGSDGIIEGVLSIIKDFDKLKNYSYFNFNVSLQVQSLSKKDNSVLFTYISSPVNIKLKNPLSANLVNLNNSVVSYNCKNIISAVSPNVLLNQVSFAGGYINATNPFTLRVYLDLENLASVTDLSVQSGIYVAIKNYCDPSSPTVGALSSNVTFLNNNFPIQSEIQDVLNPDGSNTGQTKIVYFVDLFLNSPTVPSDVLVYVKCIGRSYSLVKSFFVSFKSNVVIQLGAKVPFSDGVDIQEESALVYLVDSDYPNDISKRKSLPNNTLVKWSFVPYSNTTISRNIFSTENNGVPGGVYSKITNNLAKNVFLGPINNATVSIVNNQPVFQEYQLTVSVIYNGVYNSDSQVISIVPIGYNNVSTSSYLLIELEDIKNNLYADGHSYLKATISANPSISTTKYSTCFNTCLSDVGKQIYILNPGSKVNISSNDSNLQIISGTVVEYFNPITGLNEINTSFATIDNGSSFIPISDSEYTYVYFRYTNTSLDQSIVSLENADNNCSCINIQNIEKYQTEIVINASLTDIFNGNVVNLVGGGDLLTGIPPVIIIPMNPLKVQLVGKRNNGNFINGFTVDGVATNELLYKVSYSDQPVPDGTLVSFSSLDLFENELDFVSNMGSTRSYIIGQIAPFNQSYVSLFINPIPIGSILNSFITANVNFGLDLMNIGSSSFTSFVPYYTFGNSTSNSAFSNAFLYYNTNLLTWSQRSSLNYARCGLSLQII